MLRVVVISNNLHYLTMSSNFEDDFACCASCGIAEVDDVKLKKCACKLVQYCSVECQKEHRPQHRRACKKRVTELRDEVLFKQPEIRISFFGDCPICYLPLPIDAEKSTFIVMECCSKMICLGCWYANKMREEEEELDPAAHSVDSLHQKQMKKPIGIE